MAPSQTRAGWAVVALMAAGVALLGGCTAARNLSLGVASRTTVNLGAQPYDIVPAFGSIWVSTTAGLVRTSPAGEILARIPVAGSGEWSGVAANASAVFAMQSAGTIARIDPSTNTVVRSTSLRTPWPIDQIAATPRSVCALLDAPKSVDRFRCYDVATLKIEFAADIAPGPMAAVGDSVWIGGESLVAARPTDRSVRTALRLPRGRSVPALSAYRRGLVAFMRGPHASELLVVAGGAVVRRLPVPVTDVVGISVNSRGVWVRSSGAGGGSIGMVQPDGYVRTVAHIEAQALGFVAGPRALYTVNYRRRTETILALDAREPS